MGLSLVHLQHQVHVDMKVRRSVSLRLGDALFFCLAFFFIPQAGCSAVPFSLVSAQDEPTTFLANPDVAESSGLAAGRRNPGIFYTHNDSGDSPRFFAFDARGEDWGAFLIPGAAAVDWEDMGTAEIDGRPYLLLADVGDNFQRRKTCSLYLVEEPDLEFLGNKGGAAPVFQTITFSYDKGPVDCEAVMMDSGEGVVYLIGKNRGKDSPVFALPRPEKKSEASLVARQVANPRLARVTGVDISPDRSRALVVTYHDGYEFRRFPGETWARAFQREPRVVKLPRRRQGEAVCYGMDGRTVFLTSEGSPAPLWIRPAKK
ncbi:MAG: hypothetical protein V1816_04380 [Pseudomonadota bacterium]